MGDALLGLERADVVVEGPCFRIVRLGPVLGLQLFGEIDDAGSDEWRAAVAHVVDSVDGRGARFVVFDALAAVPTNSFASRMKTVAFAKRIASRFETVLARGDAGARYALIGRVLLAAAKLANVDHEEDRARFVAKVSAFLV